jgi:hypothetical protein
MFRNVHTWEKEWQIEIRFMKDFVHYKVVTMCSIFKFQTRPSNSNHKHDSPFLMFQQAKLRMSVC